MKTVRVNQFGGPEVLRLEEAPDPTPSAGEVLVRVHAVGINPVETYIRSGAYARLPRLPYTPGQDCAGTVEAVGAGVTAFKPGDRVYTSSTVSGSYAEKALCEEKGIHPLPAQITFAQGAALGVPYATAYRSLFHRGQARAGETVLVHGASGGVGHAALQLARATGLIVIGTAGTAKGREFVTAQGAAHVLDHTQPDYLDQLLKLTDGRGVDLILEMLANVNLGKDLTVLAKNGRIVIIGSRGKVEINPRDTMLRDADIRGMMLFNTSDADLAGIHQALVAGLERGELRPTVGREFPLCEAARAHEAVLQSGALGKIILIP